MIDAFFTLLLDSLEYYNRFFWTYIGFSVVTIFGTYLTLVSDNYQFETMGKFFAIFRQWPSKTDSLHPLRLFFLSLGGTVGLGSFIPVLTTVTIGGPGGLFWLLAASCFGMLIKYTEVYLVITCRDYQVAPPDDPDGPWSYIRYAFRSSVPAVCFAMMLIFYSADVNQFMAAHQLLTSISHWSPTIMVVCLLTVLWYASWMTLGNVGRLLMWIMPIILLSYFVVCLAVLWHYRSGLWEVLSLILPSAFNGQAALGGFVGSSFFLAVQYGTSQAVYSGDIGMGYDAMIFASTRHKDAEPIAQLPMISLLIDTMICCLSCLVVLASGAWQDRSFHDNPLAGFLSIFSSVFPVAEYWVGGIIALASIGTLSVYLILGQRAATHVLPRSGRYVFLFYGFGLFVLYYLRPFPFVTTLLGILGGLMLLINVVSLMRLRYLLRFRDRPLGVPVPHDGV